MKIIIWDFLGQAENWLAQEIHWERVEIVYKINMNFDLKYLPTILNNIPHEYVLIFENGQHIKIESLIPQLGINRDKLIFAFKIDSWLTHFDLASYLLKHDRQIFFIYRVAI